MIKLLNSVLNFIFNNLSWQPQSELSVTQTVHFYACVCLLVRNVPKIAQNYFGDIYFLLFDPYTYYVIFSLNHSNFKNQSFYTKNIQIVSFCCILVFCFIKHGWDSLFCVHVFSFKLNIHFQEQFKDKIKYMLYFFTQMNSFSPPCDYFFRVYYFLECTTQTISITPSPPLPSFIVYCTLYVILNLVYTNRVYEKLKPSAGGCQKKKYNYVIV